MYVWIQGFPLLYICVDHGQSWHGPLAHTPVYMTRDQRTAQNLSSWEELISSLVDQLSPVFYYVLIKSKRNILIECLEPDPSEQ